MLTLYATDLLHGHLHYVNRLSTSIVVVGSNFCSVGLKALTHKRSLTLFPLSCSVHRFLESLWIVVVLCLAIETLPYRLHHSTVIGQTLFVEVLGRVPQLGADQCPRALRIAPFGTIKKL